MRRGYTTPLVIAIMAFAVVAFLFLIDTAINPDGSKKSADTATTKKSTNTAACTDDAKICPDGSTVVRSGPKCEFAECPTTTNTNSTTNQNTNTATDPTAGWKTYTNTDLGYTVNYPANWKTSTCSGNETVWFGTQGVVCASDAGTWDFSITKQPTSFNLQQTLTQTKSFMVDSEQTSVTVGGVPATRLSGQTKDDIGPGSNQYIVTIYVPHNNRYFTIQYAVNGVIGEEYKNNFELFTQSFTFTD